jgi:hypothetical protein
LPPVVLRGRRPGGGDQVLEGEKLVGLLGGKETMLDQAHEDTTGEVLIALDDVDGLRTCPGHRVEMRGHRGEARRGVGRRIVATGGVSVLGALGHAEQVRRPLADIARALRGNQDQRGRPVVFHAAVEQPERAGGTAF